MPQPEMTAVSSSNLAAFGYDAEASELYIEFNDSSLYRYSSVPTDVAEGMREAPSKGQYFSGYVKGRYPYEQLN